MARYEFADRIPFPVDECYLAMRDHMAELVPFLDGIREIRVLEREEIGPGRHRILNEWVSDHRVPAAVEPFLRPDILRWLDRVIWDDATRTWRYELEFPRLPGIVRCAGTNGMRALGPAETEITVSGDLEIHVERIRGIPAFLGRRVRPAVERFVVALVEPRLRGIDAGLARYLGSRPRPAAT